MLRITVELLPHQGGQRKTLAVAEIDNVGGDRFVGEYDARFYGGKPYEDIERFGPEHLVVTSKVHGHLRLVDNLWALVGKALKPFLPEVDR